MAKLDYGIDAPGVIRNLLLAGVGCIAIGLFAPVTVTIGGVMVKPRLTGWATAVWLCLSGLLMLLYSLRGKFRHRDRMLALHAWRGNETVLDVGTGRGLLLVGAARKLTSGHATGIDIWNTVDLSGNSRERTLGNLALESVADRCTLVSESAQRMSFADGTFDVVLSNLCLHNIAKATDRNAAVREIARVLRPGGIAILSDYKNSGEYAKVLREAGLSVQLRAPNFLTTYPPLRILTARKAAVEAPVGSA